MARPKDTRVSTAFRERSDHERERLEGRLAKHLQEDMARIPAFYNKYIVGSTGMLVNVETDDAPGLQAFLRSVYTDDRIHPSPWNVTDGEHGNVTSDFEKNMTSDPYDAVTSNVNTILMSEVMVDANGNGHPQGNAAVVHDNGDSSSGGEGSNGDVSAGSDVGVSNSKSTSWGLETGCCPLGSSLLTMYHQGSNSDIIFIVNGQHFNAHRSILCARSSYFSAMLSGGWRECTTQEINLERVSAGVVEQALLFMYGGHAELSPACDLGELVVVGDMYGIAGIKDIATFLLKRDYCHFFHKPCNGCLAGVCETLPLTFTFGLDDLQERCLRWAARHFVRLWPTKLFALLPPEVLNKCCSHIINDITPTSVLDLVMEADWLSGAMPQVRWAEPVVTMTARLIDACISHISTHLVDIMETHRFLSMATTMALGLDLLLGVMQRAVTAMPVEHACRTYRQCVGLAQRTHEKDCDWSEDFCSLVRAVYTQCEQFMHQYVNLVVGTSGWKLLSTTDQAKIKEGGCFVVPDEAKKPIHKSHKKMPGAGGASRPTVLPSQRRTRGGRQSNFSKTPSPAATSSASSGGRTPQTPSSKKSGASPKQHGQTKVTPTTPGTSRPKTSSWITKKKSPTSPSLQYGASNAVSNGVAEVVAGPSGVGQPSEALSPSATASIEWPLEQSQGACSEAKLQAIARTDSTNEKSHLPSKVPVDTAVGKAKGAATPVKPGSGVAVRKTGGPAAKPHPASGASSQKARGTGGSDKHGPPSAAAGGRTSDTGANQKGCPVNVVHNRQTVGAGVPQRRSLPQKSVTSPSTARARTALTTVSAKQKQVPASTGSNSKADQLASAAKGKTQPVKKTSSPSHQETQRPQTKDAKMAANLRQMQSQPASRIASLQRHRQQKLTGKEDACRVTSAGARPGSSHLPKAKPKAPQSSSNREGYRSRSSSGSSQLSSPRSAGGTSKLPITSKFGKQRDSSESTNKENDAVFAKCTSMRIAAMKKKKPFDADFDCETESVISTLSHVAVKGSRTPSIADLDLSPNEFSLEELCNGINHHHSTGTSVDRLDGRRLLATYEEVELPAPEEHNDVIVPVLDAIFTTPRDVTKNC